MLGNRAIPRRDFLMVGATAAAGAIVAPATRAGERDVGSIGVGARGTGLLDILLTLRGVEVPAICDVKSPR
jgi:hypothetical protein